MDNENNLNDSTDKETLNDTTENKLIINELLTYISHYNNNSCIDNMKKIIEINNRSLWFGLFYQCTSNIVLLFVCSF